MIQVRGKAAEGIMRIRRRYELLKLRKIIELQMVVEQRGFYASAFTELSKCRLSGEPRSCGFSKNLLD